MNDNWFKLLHITVVCRMLMFYLRHLCIVVSNTYCPVFLFWGFFVLCDLCCQFSELFIFYCSYGILQSLFTVKYLTFLNIYLKGPSTHCPNIFSHCKIIYLRPISKKSITISSTFWSFNVASLKQYRTIYDNI